MATRGSSRQMAAPALDLSRRNHPWSGRRLRSNLPAGCRNRKRHKVTENAHPLFDFTDADLKAALHRSLRTTAILGVVLAVVLSFVYGWQTGGLVLAGTVISATGLWEW